MSRTSVIIVNYNGADDTRQCLDSLSRVSPTPKMIVVDNASTEGGVEEAMADYPGVELIHSSVNVGFGRGNNLGIRRALSETDCEFVFLLNNDATVEPQTIRRLEETLDEHPEAGIAAPRIVLTEDTGVLWYGGGEVDWRKGGVRSPGYMGAADSEDALREREVGFSSGCAMLIRRSVLERAGGFDPRLFMYEEDLELGLRIRRSGWSIRYAPEALVLHRVGGTQRRDGGGYVPELSPQNPRLPFHAFHRIKNRLLVMRLHARGKDALRFAIFFPAFLVYKCSGYALRGRWDGIRAVLSGLRESVSLIREPFVDELKEPDTGSEPASAEPVIFVVGNSRSGTTMTAHMLGRHPRVFAMNELHFFEQLWTPEDEERPLSTAEAEDLAARLLCIQRDGYLNQREASRFDKEAASLVAGMRAKPLTPARVFEEFLLREAVRGGKEIPCDHTPRNVFYLAEILKLYPEARIVSMVRDPRDVLLSQKRKYKRRSQDKNVPRRESLRSWVNYHPLTISKLWSSSARAAQRFAGDERVLAVRFEDLLSDPEGVTREICAFAGVEFDPELLQIPQIGSSSERDRPEKTGINRARAGSWQEGGLTRTEVFLCQKITGKDMKRNGYAADEVHPSPLGVAYGLASFPFKLALAFLLNLGRMRRVAQTIKRRL